MEISVSRGAGWVPKKVLILVQRPQHKSSSDPVGAPKNNPFGAIFIEFGHTKKCCTFSGLELVLKSRKKLIGALSSIQKGLKFIQTLWDHQKKSPFVENYKECAICGTLGKKSHFGAFSEAKKRCCACLGVLKILPRGPQKCKSLGLSEKTLLL